MSQKLILFFISIIFFSSFNLAQAGVLFSEIMYDLEGSDEGMEWVEIHNATGETVDFSEYKFFEGDVNHKLVLIEGSPRLEPSQYALLVSSPLKFKTKYPNFSGNIFDSSFTLSNTGESLAIKDKDLKIMDQVVYKSSMGGAGNGRTISKIDGLWRESRPTPGAGNQIYVAPVVSTPPSKPSPKILPSTAVEKINLNSQIVALPLAPLLDEGVSEGGKNYLSFLFFLVGLIFFLGASATLVYFIRRKKVPPKAGDDFKILEGE